MQTAEPTEPAETAEPTTAPGSAAQQPPSTSDEPDPATQPTDTQEVPEPANQAGPADVPAPPTLTSTEGAQAPSPRRDAETPDTAVAKPGELSLSIPAIGVQSVLNPLGLDGAGALEVPARGPDYNEAAWFTGSPYPGETGPTVLLGHVNGRGGAPSIFYRLAELGVGDVVTVSRPDGSQVSFECLRLPALPEGRVPDASRLRRHGRG